VFFGICCFIIQWPPQWPPNKTTLGLCRTAWS